MKRAGLQGSWLDTRREVVHDTFSLRAQARKKPATTKAMAPKSQPIQGCRCQPGPSTQLKTAIAPSALMLIAHTNACHGRITIRR